MQTPKMQHRPNKTTQIGIRIDEATRRKAERKAKKANRTLSDYIRLLIENDASAS